MDSALLAWVEWIQSNSCETHYPKKLSARTSCSNIACCDLILRRTVFRLTERDAEPRQR